MGNLSYLYALNNTAKYYTTVFQNKNKMKLMEILHDVKLYFCFFQAANDIIKLVIAKLMADIRE